jgi:hypothetical protein
MLYLALGELISLDVPQRRDDSSFRLPGVIADALRPPALAVSQVAVDNLRDRGFAPALLDMPRQFAPLAVEERSGPFLRFPEREDVDDAIGDHNVVRGPERLIVLLAPVVA